MTIKNFLIIAVVGCFSLALTTAKGQNFQYANKLMEVSFSDPKVPRYISIRKDDNSAYFVAPHWTAAEKKPVAYVSGGHPNIGAKFRMSCKPRADVWVYGKNDDGFNMKAQKLTFQSADPTLGVYSPIESDGTFTANVVKYYPDFTIKWFVSDNQSGANAQEIGTSVNPLYVTFQDVNALPLLGLGGRASFYTLLHLGCKNAADLSDEATIVKDIYSEFTDREVARVENPQPMYYWGPLSAPPAQGYFTTAQLLAFGDGRCGAWTNFFVDILRTQGIKSELIEVTWTPRSQNGAGPSLLDVSTASEFAEDVIANGLSRIDFVFPAVFFVKNWKIKARTFSDWNYTGMGGQQFDAPMANNDVDGSPAQNNNNPWSLFSDHALVRYNGNLYDPSYGTDITDSLLNWENANLDGFGTYTRVQDFMNITYKLWFKKNNDDTDPDMQNLTVLRYR